MNKSSFRAAWRTLIGMAFAVTITAGLMAPASAAPTTAAVDCTGDYNHADFSPDFRGIASGKVVRSGPYQICTDRFSGYIASVNLHCWYYNDEGNYWWFLTTSDGRKGWTYEPNLTGTTPSHANAACPR